MPLGKTRNARVGLFLSGRSYRGRRVHEAMASSMIEVHSLSSVDNSHEASCACHLRMWMDSKTLGLSNKNVYVLIYGIENY